MYRHTLVMNDPVRVRVKACCMHHRFTTAAPQLHHSSLQLHHSCTTAAKQNNPTRPPPLPPTHPPWVSDKLCIPQLDESFPNCAGEQYVLILHKHFESVACLHMCKGRRAWGCINVTKISSALLQLHLFHVSANHCLQTAITSCLPICVVTWKRLKQRNFPIAKEIQATKEHHAHIYPPSPSPLTGSSTRRSNSSSNVGSVLLLTVRVREEWWGRTCAREGGGGGSRSLSQGNKRAKLAVCHVSKEFHASNRWPAPQTHELAPAETYHTQKHTQTPPPLPAHTHLQHDKGVDLVKPAAGQIVGAEHLHVGSSRHSTSCATS